MTAKRNQLNRLYSIKQVIGWGVLSIATLINPNFEFITGINASLWRKRLIAIALLGVGIMLGKIL